MANDAVSTETVKKTVSSLECSPSMHDESGKYGGAPNILPTAKSSSAVTVSKEKTSEFQMSRQSGKVPGYKSKFAKGARQE